MPYKKSKKISRRRNKRGTKHRSKRFRKSKRKTKYHKRGGGWWGDLITENRFSKAMGWDNRSMEMKTKIANCKKEQDEIIKKAQNAKEECNYTQTPVPAPAAPAPESPAPAAPAASPPESEMPMSKNPASGGVKNRRRKKTKRKYRKQHH